MYDKSEFRHLKSSVPHSSISSSDTGPCCGSHLKPLHFCLIAAVMKSFPKQLLYGRGKGCCTFAELALRQRLLHICSLRCQAAVDIRELALRQWLLHLCTVAHAGSHPLFGKFFVFTFFHIVL